MQQAGAEVICHNDWGPTNAVFENGIPYGIIDFDTVAPGLRLSDLGQSAWLWLDVGNPDYSAEEQLRRLSIFAEAYSSPAGSIRGERGLTGDAEWSFEVIKDSLSETAPSRAEGGVRVGAAITRGAE